MSDGGHELVFYLAKPALLKLRPKGGPSGQSSIIM